MQRSLAYQEYENTKKKPVATWLLWLFLGSFGAHRYYLGDTKQAIFMTIAGLIGWFPGLIWCLIDGLKVNGRLRTLNSVWWRAIAYRHRIDEQPAPVGAH